MGGCAAVSEVPGCNVVVRRLIRELNKNRRTIVQAVWKTEVWPEVPYRNKVSLDLCILAPVLVGDGQLYRINARAGVGMAG